MNKRFGENYMLKKALSLIIMLLLVCGSSWAKTTGKTADEKPLCMKTLTSLPKSLFPCLDSGLANSITTDRTNTCSRLKFLPVSGSEINDN